MIRIPSCVVALLLVLASAPSASASRCGGSETKGEPVHVATVCELARWDQTRVGTRVRIHAEYFTDFHHGAFLSDPRCPSVSLQIGIDATNADNSVANLDMAIGQNRKFYIGHKFKVDVTGVFEWNEGKVINAELPPDRQLRIPPHGQISLLKVWSFEQPER